MSVLVYVPFRNCKHSIKICNDNRRKNVIEVETLNLGFFFHALFKLQLRLSKVKREITKNLYENRMCSNQWDNWRAYGPELLL